jgi:ribosome-associated protein
VIVRVSSEEQVDQAVEVWRAAEAGRGKRPPAVRIAEVRQLVADSVCVMVIEDVPLAMAAGTLEDEEIEVTLAAVVPAQQRQGVGGSVVEALADVGWELGARTMAVWTEQTPFFEAIGFEATGRARDSIKHLTAELEAPLRQVVVGSTGIRLGQLLKLAELVETGAEGKALLAAGVVEVNGEVEIRRGRQMVDGDEVRARDQAIRVVILPA